MDEDAPTTWIHNLLKELEDEETEEGDVPTFYTESEDDYLEEDVHISHSVLNQTQMKYQRSPQKKKPKING